MYKSCKYYLQVATHMLEYPGLLTMTMGNISFLTPTCKEFHTTLCILQNTLYAHHHASWKNATHRIGPHSQDYWMTVLCKGSYLLPGYRHRVCFFLRSSFDVITLNITWVLCCLWKKIMKWEEWTGRSPSSWRLGANECIFFLFCIWLLR